MGKVWKIIASTKRIGGGPALKEYFRVAIDDQAEALVSLWKRRKLDDAELTVVGDAAPQYVEWLDVHGGEIFCVMAIS